MTTKTIRIAPLIWGPGLALLLLVAFGILTSCAAGPRIDREGLIPAAIAAAARRRQRPGALRSAQPTRRSRPCQ